MRDRVVRARILGDRCQQGCFGRAHLRGPVVEVDARGLLDAVGTVPEVDGVQVRGEDPVLRPPLLELPGERRLAELAADRLLVRQVGVLDELLGDRRAALHRAAVRDVGPDGAAHAAHVDAAVLVEALVLGRDDRVLHPGRDPCRGDDDPCLLAAQDREHGVPVRCVDVRVRLGLLLRRVELRDLRGNRGQETDGKGCRAQEPENDKEGEKSELADPPTTRPACISPKERQNRGSLARL